MGEMMQQLLAVRGWRKESERMSDQESKTNHQNRIQRNPSLEQHHSPKWAQRIGWWVLAIFGAGIVNSTFDGFFGVCSSVIKNTSSGFWSKFLDVYYALAATAELTDSASKLELTSVLLLLMWGWMLFSRLHRRDENKVPEGERDTHARTRVCDRSHKWTKYFLVIITFLVLYNLSLSMVSYDLLKLKQRCIVFVRPFITDLEYHQLNRQWLMMKSRSDYLAFKQQIEEYAQRGPLGNGQEKDGEP